jgi:hypothetical protein
MPNDMFHTVEFSDVVGQRNLIVLSSRTEANEFIDLGLKRWHFANMNYHYYTLRELAEEKAKLH